MNIVQAEENLKKITAKFSKESFIYDLMRAYDFPKATISRLQKGTSNQGKNENEIFLKKKLYFASASKKDLEATFEKAKKECATQKDAPRFIIVTDYKTIRAYDTKMGESLETDIKSLPKHPDFFLPWTGIEKKVFQGENPADVKAAEKLAKLFDLIKLDNIKQDDKSRHALNVFLTRVLFCFFAEDTGIFENGLFTNSIASHTGDDAKDLAAYFSSLFEILNTDEKKRPKKTPEYLAKFPYVNGGLFAEDHPIPKFSKRSRTALIELGELNWAEINPDIFGSMIQAVVHPDQRAGLGMHYTSVTNIMKVIEPLFLSELHEEFEKAKGSKPRLNKLLGRISNIKIFDPACGSGNFLIIAYKELRLLEMKILKALGGFSMSGISLSNFYGIEIDDFAHEVAKLSLWLAEHQMDILFKQEFGSVKASLPLKDSGRIFCVNAVTTKWAELVRINASDDIYILGNPPYLGTRNQKKNHKEDMKNLLGNLPNYKTLDYISAWLYQARNFIMNHENCKAAFVATNSICQGDQVAILWPLILDASVEIIFAHQSFKWANNAKSQAGVSCVIVGLGNRALTRNKIIYTSGSSKACKNINAYLVDGDNIVVGRASEPISEFPKMMKGSIPADGGYLLIDKAEYEIFFRDPELKPFIKKFIGAQELIKGIERWCFYLNEADYKEIKNHPKLKDRFLGVERARLESTKKPTQELAKTPWKFAEDRYFSKPSLVIPCVTSEERRIIPMGFVPPGPVIYATAQAIYDPDYWVLAVLCSRMHMVWTRATAGRHESRIRYSSSLCYNTFPLPKLSEMNKNELNNLVKRLLAAREKYSNLTLVDIYDSDGMPKEISEIHDDIDAYVEGIFSKKIFKSDEERLEVLLGRYCAINGEK